MTQRFEEFKDILTPAAEEETPSAPARAIASIRRTLAEGPKKNATLAAFVAGLLTGSILSIVSGLLR